MGNVQTAFLGVIAICGAQLLWSAYQYFLPAAPRVRGPRLTCRTCGTSFALSRQPARRGPGPLGDYGYRCFPGEEGMRHHLVHWDRRPMQDEGLYEWEVVCAQCGLTVPVGGQQAAQFDRAEWGALPGFDCPRHSFRAS